MLYCNLLFLNKLPKTRSGKILRGTIRKISNDQHYNFPATIEDETTLDVIKTLSAEFRALIKERECVAKKTCPLQNQGPKDAPLNPPEAKKEPETAEEKQALEELK